MLRGMETGGPVGNRGCWLTAAGSGIGNPDKVGTGAAGNWFNISGLTAGIPLCKGRKREDNQSYGTHEQKGILGSHSFGICTTETKKKQGFIPASIKSSKTNKKK